MRTGGEKWAETLVWPYAFMLLLKILIPFKALLKI